MFIVHVFIEVKPDCIEDFIKATIINAKESIQEPGITRFDVIQDSNSPTKFVLVEVYRTKDDPAKHKVTDHYQQWQSAVAAMMAEPRKKQIFSNIFPSDEGWEV